MYSDYQKIQKFFNSAGDLLKTSQSMQEIFLAATKHKKERAFTFMNDKGKPVSYNYKHYRRFCFEAGSRLSQILKEIPSNSVVALKVKNCPEWAHIFWGLLMCGFIPFLIDAKLPKENTENLLKQSKAAAIVTGEIFKYSVTTINALNINDIKVDYRFAEKWANRVIFCSSGTTGNVKLMVYNGANICAQVAACLEMPQYTPDIMYPGEVNILALVPFHHIFGFVAVFLWYTFFGKNIVYVRDLSPTEVQNTSRKCNVTHVYSVPLFWDSMAQSLLRRVEMEGGKKSEIVNKMIAYNTKKISSEEAGLASTKLAQQKVQDMLLGHKIRFCISGGGSISAETLNTINGIGYPLYNGYGMTEAGVTSVELAQRVEYRLKGSIGRPLHGVEYKLFDRQKLHKNVGELAIKSPITHIYEIIDGVEQEPQLEDGWLRTGDIASVDETGFYFLKGRIKDVIINANGENIYPDEIEDYFKDIPGVTKLCVVGFKKGKSSHEIITCIIELSNDVDDNKLKEIKLKLDSINLTLSNEKIEKQVEFQEKWFKHIILRQAEK